MNDSEAAPAVNDSGNRKPKKRRKAVSMRLRFDVFKRDDFTCQYCGRKTPSVILEVDHIVPVAEGGGGEIENLTTSCVDCNAGKGAVPLTSKKANADLSERKQLIIDREAQLRAYNKAVEGRLKRENSDYDEAFSYWHEVYGCKDGYRIPVSHLPYQNVLRSYLGKLTLAQVKQAMKIANERVGSTGAMPKYFLGVLKGMVAENEGRMVNCRRCNGHIRLNPEDDPKLEWWHNDCLEKAQGAGK